MATAVSGAQPTAAHEQAVHRELMRFGEAESLATPLWEDRDTTVRAVAAHLSSLWSSSAPAAPDAGPVVTEKGLSHARASVLNLIVTVVDTDAADRVVRTLTGLGVRHPSRAIILVPDPAGGGPKLDARISAHCNDTSSGSDQVCYEEVVLTVRGESASHLNGIVAPLLIHDLPTHVWWPGDPPFRDPIFDQLVEVADRLIVDSADFGDLLPGLRRLANLRRRSGVGDLSWERLAWWQELTAQFFDAPRFRRYLPNLSRLQLRYAVPAAPAQPLDPDEASEVAPGTPAPIVQALLYAGWIATRLGWRRHATLDPLADGACRLRLEGRHEMVELHLEPVPTDEVRSGDLLSVRLRSLGETGAAEFIIDRDGDWGTVATNADGMTALLRRVGMGSPTEHELLSAQLAIDSADPVYEAALRAAAVLLDASLTAGQAA
ncbi:MAG TPA: glucose-6-phosphate dehydrogenase assembly protein OpcA [Candidatus Angelobacter sp.]|nr:glucose-6-phosphate dehydrogenase assembly protein OpcA [Candidatus Angelobacter sp.]